MSGIPDRLAAALADRYRLERELGQGGMATVYLAEDLKHKRRVALKVLKPELAAVLGAERFLQEITTTAALRHPHILPLYDSGSVVGPDQSGPYMFYVMPFIDGETLRNRLDRESQLPLQDAVRIACEVADALSYAHGRGVIHRDIKPENILLDNGHAVVADFGIAQAVSDSGGERLTQTGLVLGTPLYMSPEQAGGEPVDARSDLYALACVTYEMLAGSPPFSGATALAVMARHALDPVPALRTPRPGIPAAMADAVEQALAKTPADRFPTVQAWRDALAEAASAKPESGNSSSARRAAEGFWVGVLPFRYNGSDRDVTALTEGLPEEIVTGLSRFSYVRVIAHGSGGRELGASYLLEGSLRQSGARLRVAVQLVDASSGAHLWAESYDRTFSPDTVFELQDELVPRIVSTIADMNGVLPHLMSEAIRTRAPTQLTPLEAVLRSMGYLQRLGAEEHAEVRDALERAVRIAPSFADAWALLSMVYCDEHKQGFNPRPDSLARALQAARRAVLAAPGNHLGYHALALATFFQKDFGAFRPAAERAVALNPMDGCTIAFMGILMAYAGDWEQGLRLVDRALHLNPRHPGWYRFANFYNAFRQGDFRGALEVALKLNMPTYFYSHVSLAAAYGALGDTDGARRALAELAILKPDFGQVARQEMGKWVDESIVAQVVDALRKAGLQIPVEGGPSGD